MIHGAELCFREFGQIRTVSHPEAAALPAGFGIIDSAIQAARIERHRVRHAEHRERFLLRIKNQHGIRIGAGDDHRIFAESERIELVDP